MRLSFWFSFWFWVLLLVHHYVKHSVVQYLLLVVFCFNCASGFAYVCASGGASSSECKVALSIDTDLLFGFFGVV